jgi:hypothetical protein
MHLPARRRVRRRAHHSFELQLALRVEPYGRSPVPAHYSSGVV